MLSSSKLVWCTVVACVLTLSASVHAFPIGYNLTQCDLDECHGHGICVGRVHRCDCEPDWFLPDCRLDLRSSADRDMVDTWHYVTIAIAAMIAIVGIWRCMVLAYYKYHYVVVTHAGFAVYRRCTIYTMVIDSQLSCMIFICTGVIILMVALSVGIIHGEIQHYLLHMSMALLIAAIALYTRVFVRIVMKYAGRATLATIRWLDRGWMAYMMIITVTIILRPLTNVQITSPLYYITIGGHLAFLVSLIIGGSVFARTVVIHTIRSTLAVVPTQPSSTIVPRSTPIQSRPDGTTGTTGTHPTLPLMNTTGIPSSGLQSAAHGAPLIIANIHHPPHPVLAAHPYSSRDPPSGVQHHDDPPTTSGIGRTGNTVVAFQPVSQQHQHAADVPPVAVVEMGAGSSASQRHYRTYGTTTPPLPQHGTHDHSGQHGSSHRIAAPLLGSPLSPLQLRSWMDTTLTQNQTTMIAAAMALQAQATALRIATLRMVLRTIRVIQLVCFTVMVTVLITTVILPYGNGDDVTYIMYTWTIQYYVPLIGAALLMVTIGTRNNY